MEGFDVFSHVWDAGQAYVLKNWLLPVNAAACALITVESVAMMFFVIFRNVSAHWWVKVMYGLTACVAFSYVVGNLDGQYDVVSFLETALHVCVAGVFAELVVGWNRRYVSVENGNGNGNK